MVPRSFPRICRNRTLTTKASRELTRTSRLSMQLWFPPSTQLARARFSKTSSKSWGRRTCFAPPNRLFTGGDEYYESRSVAMSSQPVPLSCTIQSGFFATASARKPRMQNSIHRYGVAIIGTGPSGFSAVKYFGIVRGSRELLHSFSRAGMSAEERTTA